MVRHMKKLKQFLVWDPLVRIFHWLLAVCFLVAYILEDKMLNLHVLVGSIVFGLIIFRLTWGVMGTKHSRFADFICSFKQIIRHLCDLVRMRPAQHTGHTPVGGVMIFLLLFGLLLLTLSGIMLYALEGAVLPFAGLMSGIDLDTTILIESIHGWVADLLVLFVVFHVAGVFFESFLQKQNLIRAMITGYKKENE
jgi:cytochrome b